MGNIAILAGGDSALLPRDHDAYVGVDGGAAVYPRVRRFPL